MGVAEMEEASGAACSAANDIAKSKRDSSHANESLFSCFQVSSLFTAPPAVTSPKEFGLGVVIRSHLERICAFAMHSIATLNPEIGDPILENN
jgi:hypothetical protein